MYAADYDEVLDALTDSRHHNEILVAMVRQISCTTPREGAWELTYRAMQVRARRILEDLAEKERTPKGVDHA